MMGMMRNSDGMYIMTNQGDGPGNCDGCVKFGCDYRKHNFRCEEHTIESCDNCAKKGYCSYLTDRYRVLPPPKCSRWKLIVAFPELVKRIANTINHETAREQGYEQAIEDAKCFCTASDYRLFLEMKKERFHPEPTPAVEEKGYQRCLDNIKEWWSGTSDGLPPLWECVDRDSRDLVQLLLMVLRDKK